MSGIWSPPKTWVAAILPFAEMNQYVRDNENYLKTHIALEAAGALTIASGIITVTQAYHKVKGEGAANDNLDTIGGGLAGMIIVLRPDGNVITLEDAINNLHLGCDFVMPTDEYFAVLFYDGANWLPIGGRFQMVKEFLLNDFEYPAPGTGWSSSLMGATLPESKTAEVIALRVAPIEIGDAIISYKLVGDMTEAAAATLDCRLIIINKADPLTTTDIPGGAIAQVVDDGNFDVEAILANYEVIATDKQYALIITGTTGVGDSITVMGAEIKLLSL